MTEGQSGHSQIVLFEVTATVVNSQKKLSKIRRGILLPARAVRCNE